jgi:hypothetical protein
MDFLQNFKRKRRDEMFQEQSESALPTLSDGEDASLIPTDERMDAVLAAGSTRPRTVGAETWPYSAGLPQPSAPNTSTIPPEVIEQAMANFKGRQPDGASSYLPVTPSGEIASGSPVPRDDQPLETTTNDAGEKVAPIAPTSAATRDRFDNPPLVRHDSKGRPVGVSMHAPDKAKAEIEVNRELQDYEPQKGGLKEWFKHFGQNFLKGWGATGSPIGGVGSAAVGGAIDAIDRTAADRDWKQVALGQSDNRIEQNTRREVQNAQIDAIRRKPETERRAQSEKEIDNLRQIWNSLPSFDPDHNPEHKALASQAKRLGYTLPRKDDKDSLSSEWGDDGRLYVINKRTRQAQPVDGISDQGRRSVSVNIGGSQFTVSQTEAARNVATAGRDAARASSDTDEAELANQTAAENLTRIEGDIQYRREALEQIKQQNGGKAPEGGAFPEPGYAEYQRLARELTDLEQERRNWEGKRKAAPKAPPAVTVASGDDPLGIRR